MERVPRRARILEETKERILERSCGDHLLIYRHGVAMRRKDKYFIKLDKSVPCLDSRRTGYE